MKTCSKCNVKKNESCFNKNKSRKDGLSPYCKLCRSLIHKVYMEHEDYRNDRINRNKEYRKTEHGQMISKAYRDKISAEQKEYKKHYYKENKESIQLKHKKYYSINKGRIIFNAVMYKSKNRDKWNAYSREWTKRQVKNLAVGYVKAQLKNRGYTNEQIEIIPELIPIKKIQIINHRITKPKNKKQ